MKLRFATPGDAQALLDIYARYIDTPITFEYELPSREEFARRISSTLERYPYLVAEEEGKALGYAYAHPERERAAYQWNTELSVYLAPEAVGRGIGTALYTALMELLRLQGAKTAYGVVTAPNPASEGLHRSLGFRLLGVHRNTGFKNGVWYDVLWFEKSLADYEADPKPVVPVGRLSEQEICRILNNLQ